MISHFLDALLDSAGLGAIWFGAAFCLAAVWLWTSSRRPRTGPLNPWRRRPRG